MAADLQVYLDWLDGHGVRFAVGEELEREADHDGPLLAGGGERVAVEISGVAPFVEHRDVAAGLGADHATHSLAKALVPLVAPGTRVWDVGCGTGVLAVAAALAGGRAVVGTDIDERALALARRTAADANVAVSLLSGSLLEPIPAHLTAELVAANLPHKPVSAGEEGDALHGPFVAQAAVRLRPGARVLFFLHSLPHPRLLQQYGKGFDLTLLSWKRRFLGAADPRAQYLERAARGVSYVGEDGKRRFLIGGVWSAERR